LNIVQDVLGSSKVTLSEPCVEN